MKRNNSLCFFVSIMGLQTARRHSLAKFNIARITILAKTNREQSLIVHALFGKRNLRH